MLRAFEIPDNVRKQIGNFYIVAVPKSAPDVGKGLMEMHDGDEILLGPLLTAGEAETLIPAVTAFYVATMSSKHSFGIGLARIEVGGYTGRFNPLLALDPEGKTLPPDLYEKALDELQGTLAPNEADLKWLNDLPPQVQTVAKDEIGPALSVVTDRGDTVRSLIAAYGDASKREGANLLLDLLLASGGTLPASLLSDLFKVRLIDRWGRKAGDDVG